eukprot:762036-Hanusia_phi.AAC.2
MSSIVTIPAVPLATREESRVRRSQRAPTRTRPLRLPCELSAAASLQEHSTPADNQISLRWPSRSPPHTTSSSPQTVHDISVTLPSSPSAPTSLTVIDSGT